MSALNICPSIFSDKTVLYLEDINRFKNSIENYLKATFESVVSTTHVNAAMQLLINNKIDMLVVDLYDEAMKDRVEFLNNLKCFAPYLPIVIIVKESSMLKVVSTLDYSVSHVILKPIERVLLEKELQKVYKRVKRPIVSNI